MVPESGTGRIATGIKNVHMAELLTDVIGGSTTYDTPWRMDGVSDGLDATNNDSTETYYGDNQAAEMATTFGDIDISISRQSLDDAQRAFIGGHEIVNGFVEEKSSDNPPYLATMWEVTFSDGASKFVQVDKSRFTPPSTSVTTKTDTTSFQSDSYVGKGIMRLSDGRRKRSRIVPAAEVDAFRTTFFANANDASPSALTLITVPADAATGVAVGDDFTFTFSNDMQVSTINNQNIKCIKVSDGTEVALTFTTDTEDTVFSASHADLSAATDYILIVTDNARDIFGQGITQIANFTTA